MEQSRIIDIQTAPLSKNNFNNPALLRDIPFDKMYQAARKEASRKKPAFFLHKYFSRRITSNFRMMLLGSLLPYEADIWDYFYRSFENEKLEDLVVLDPFMGGGTTIFESLRFNTKTIGCDLQPLSKFISSALVKDMDIDIVNEAKQTLEKGIAPQIMHYYKTCCPICQKKADIIYTFHVKKVAADGSCKEHKLFSSFVLALKKDEFTLICPACGEVYKHDFKKNGPAVCKCGYKIVSPQAGFVKHGVFKCEKCGEKHTISEFDSTTGYPFLTNIIAIEYYCPHCGSHDYKRIDDSDQALYDEACNEFDRIGSSLPIPLQEIPRGYNTNQILNHGYKKFSDLFNKRQLLCLGMLLNKINQIDNKNAQFWLHLAFSGMLEMNNMFCRYQANACKLTNIFFNHAYVPINMPVENCVWGTKLGTGSFLKTLEKIIRGKKFCTEIYDISTINKNGNAVAVKNFSGEKVAAMPVEDWDSTDATHPLLKCVDSRHLDFLPDSSVDLVLTDPPYGANVMYSELIDFFHVWNYNSTLASELGFAKPLSPKEPEIIVNSVRGQTQKDYEKGLVSVFSECNKKLKSNGFLIFSFHDKNIESWLSILNSIDQSNYSLIKTYPLHAEARTGAHTSNKNSIALDIMLICRKQNNVHMIELNEKVHKEIIKTSYMETESIISRLLNVNAEITVPDIENIFISQYFSIATGKGISYKSLISDGLDDLLICTGGLKDYFSKYNISERRIGWWSELYKKKWEL